MIEADSLKLVLMCRNLLENTKKLRAYVEDPPKKIQKAFNDIEVCAAVLHGLSMMLSDNPTIQKGVPKAFKIAWEEMDHGFEDTDPKVVMLDMAEKFKDF